MNLKKIICPTDFSRFSEAALKYASSLAAESNAVLQIVHVGETDPTYVPGYSASVYAPPPVETREQEAREHLATVTPSVAGVQYEQHFLRGSAEKEILAFAEREQADLIVLGSHGRTGLARVLMGSIAEAVVRHAHCPVLTVKQPASASHGASAPAETQAAQ